MTTPNKEYNLTWMNNPNTEGTAPMVPPPLATYPLRGGMARPRPRPRPLTAACAGRATRATLPAQAALWAREECP